MKDATDMVKAAKKATVSADPTNHPKGIAAAGAALIALPYAAQGIAKLKGGGGGSPPGAGKAAELGRKAKDKTVGKAADAAKDVVGDVAEEKVKPSLPSMPSGIGKLFGGSGDDEDEGREGGSAAPGHGSGRRMPIQQSVDVAVPIAVAYDLWTQFEDWPSFMHRVDQVQQVDEATISMSTKVWGITKRFEADIVEQRPEERIEWDVTQGLAHTGVATFHELAPRLTRIEVTVDVNPDSLLEKAGRGMRFSKRAVRGDLHRFKAYAEIAEEAEEGGWRGEIEDGEVKSKSGGSRSNGRSSRSGTSKSKNGSGPSSRSSRKSGSRS